MTLARWSAALARGWPWLAAALHAGLLWLASSLHAVPGTPAFPGVDKLQHAGAYAVLGALLAAGVARVPPRRAWVAAVVLAAAYGAVDEWHQSWVPGRDSSAYDWLADTLGAALGAGAVVYRRARAARRGRGVPDGHRP